jgi:hypothetical protein
MQFSPEQVERIKDQLKAGLATLTPEQVVRFGFGMFAIGAVVAEGLLNNRERMIAERERRMKGKPE